MPQFKRDDDVGRFGVVHLQTGLAVVAPAGQSHHYAGHPGGRDRFHDVEPPMVEKEGVFAEQAAVEAGGGRRG
jgi:hypothetical protein